LAQPLTELARVSKEWIIVYIPTYTPLSELNLLSRRGVVRYLRQQKLKLYRWRKKDDSVSHDRKALVSLFERLGLEVVERTCVDSEDDKFRSLGSDRDLYLLRKRGR
jgi:hypothetical protein